MTDKKYQIKKLFIARRENPIIYDLEEDVKIAIRKVLSHRVDRYNEDYWCESLPATIFTILDG